MSHGYVDEYWIDGQWVVRREATPEQEAVIAKQVQGWRDFIDRYGPNASAQTIEYGEMIRPGSLWNQVAAICRTIMGEL